MILRIFHILTWKNLVSILILLPVLIQNLELVVMVGILVKIGLVKINHYILKNILTILVVQQAG